MPKCGKSSDLVGFNILQLVADRRRRLLSIRVVAESGDDSRAFKPPSVNGESCYFMSFNRNKKSIVIDIKTKEGRKLIEQVNFFFGSHAFFLGSPHLLSDLLLDYSWPSRRTFSLKTLRPGRWRKTVSATIVSSESPRISYSVRSPVLVHSRESLLAFVDRL